MFDHMKFIFYSFAFSNLQWTNRPINGVQNVVRKFLKPQLAAIFVTQDNQDPIFN